MQAAKAGENYSHKMAGHLHDGGPLFVPIASPAPASSQPALGRKLYTREQHRRVFVAVGFGVEFSQASHSASIGGELLYYAALIQAGVVFI